MPKTKQLLVGLGVGALLAGGGGWGVAMASSSDKKPKVISACYSKSTGELRVVSKASACRSTEKPLTWNTTGKPGPAGPTGATGPSGPPGASAASERWVMIGADGTIVQQSGGFSVVNCYQANSNCYINAGSDVRNRAISSEIVTANGPRDAGTPTQLPGDSSSARCGLDIVACQPLGTEANNVFVVTPRNSDGTAVDTAGGQKNYTFVVKISAQPAVP